MFLLGSFWSKKKWHKNLLNLRCTKHTTRTNQDTKSSFIYYISSAFVSKNANNNNNNKKVLSEGVKTKAEEEQKGGFVVNFNCWKIIKYKIKRNLTVGMDETLFYFIFLLFLIQIHI